MITNLRGEHNNGASEAANRDEAPDAAEEACDAYEQGAMARQLDEWASRQRGEDCPPPYDKRRRLNPVHDKLWILHVESSKAAPSSSSSKATPRSSSKAAPSSSSNAAPTSSSKAAPSSPSTAAPSSSSKAAPFDNYHDSSDEEPVHDTRT